jgi:serine/threonine-protein kinase
LAELEKGRAVEPEHPLIKIFHGERALQSRQSRVAQALAEETLQQHPHFDALRVFHRALPERQRPTRSSARADYRPVKETAAADHDIAFWLASFYAMEDMRDEAIDWLQRAVKLGNENYPYFEQNKKLDKLAR